MVVMHSGSLPIIKIVVLLSTVFTAGNPLIPFKHETGKPIGSSYGS